MKIILGIQGSTWVLIRKWGNRDTIWESNCKVIWDSSWTWWLNTASSMWKLKNHYHSYLCTVTENWTLCIIRPWSLYLRHTNNNVVHCRGHYKHSNSYVVYCNDHYRQTNNCVVLSSDYRQTNNYVVHCSDHYKKK